MTYGELYESATRKLEESEINLGEYEEMMKPLNEDVRTWIPVSERLPEETGKCIVTAFDGVKSRSTYAHFQKTVGNFILTGRRSAWRVIAWMPMPEPYEAGGVEK